MFKLGDNSGKIFFKDRGPPVDIPIAIALYPIRGSGLNLFKLCDTSSLLSSISISFANVKESNFFLVTALILSIMIVPYATSLSNEIIAIVSEDHRKKIKYSCAPCKPSDEEKSLPCVEACESKAITHSW